MDELKRHVDSLFRGYKETLQVRELKREMLSNLEAKASDLAAGGMDYMDAVNAAKGSITSIDDLIDGNTKVYINKLKIEFLQIVLMFSLTAWIITIPLKIFGMGTMLNFLLMFICAGLGAAYLNKVLKNDPEYLNKEAWINIKSAGIVRKASWIFCVLFILFNILYITALQFGSNIWFSRPVHLDGPYQFAVIAAKYLLPVLVIFIPLSLNNAPKLILKYEVVCEDENQE